MDDNIAALQKFAGAAKLALIQPRETTDEMTGRPPNAQTVARRTPIESAPSHRCRQRETQMLHIRRRPSAPLRLSVEGVAPVGATQDIPASAAPFFGTVGALMDQDGFQPLRRRDRPRPSPVTLGGFCRATVFGGTSESTDAAWSRRSTTRSLGEAGYAETPGEESATPRRKAGDPGAQAPRGS